MCRKATEPTGGVAAATLGKRSGATFRLTCFYATNLHKNRTNLLKMRIYVIFKLILVYTSEKNNARNFGKS